MVVALGPGRFYGSSLPRPRFFPGGGDRVDPPAPVNDALLSWAHEAHWSMGGLNAKRLRLQGRIEGNIEKLRRTARRDVRVKARAAGVKAAFLAALGSDVDASDGDSDEEEAAAQERILKREVLDDDEDSDGSDESDDEDEPLATIATAAKKKRARKLGDEFDRIAAVEKQKPASATPATASPRRKAAAEASAPVAAAPATKSRKRKASALAAAAPAPGSPRKKAAVPSVDSSLVAGTRRTSPRNKH
jgi:hypothetical protein